jgi:hypothetical protein
VVLILFPFSQTPTEIVISADIEDDKKVELVKMLKQKGGKGEVRSRIEKIEWF